MNEIMNANETVNMNETVKFYKGQKVRIILLDGDPWFVAEDAAKILGYPKVKDMTRRLDTDEKTTLQIPQDGSNNKSNITLISEFGFFNAIKTGNKRKAEDLERWLTRDVLPSVYNNLEQTDSAVKSEQAAELMPFLQTLMQLMVVNYLLQKRAEYLEQFVPEGEACDSAPESDTADWRQTPHCGCSPEETNMDDGNCQQNPLRVHAPMIVIAKTANIYNINNKESGK